MMDALAIGDKPQSDLPKISKGCDVFSPAVCLCASSP